MKKVDIEAILRQDDGLTTETVQVTVQHELPAVGRLMPWDAPDDKVDHKNVRVKEDISSDIAAPPVVPVERPTQSEDGIRIGGADGSTLDTDAKIAEANDWTQNPETAGRHRKDTVERVKKRAKRINRLREEQEADQRKIDNKNSR